MKLKISPAVLSIALLLAIFALALFLRVFFSYGAVFSEPMKYSADDGVYHMRLVENQLLGGHFPWRIYFDPYTYFPYGTYIHFAPLYDWLLALIIWIATLGKPTLSAINKIAPFYPAVLGSLLVFPVFFIAKTLWKDSKIALFASFLAGTFSSFLYRSMLGITDHHVAEVLFSTLSLMFLIMCLKWRGKALQKKFWLYALLAGISLGLYFLAWAGALFVLFIIFSFIVFYYLIEYFFGRRQNDILHLGIVIFITAFLMIAPFFGHPDLYNTYMFSIRHILAFGFGLLGFAYLLAADSLFFKRKINPRLFPLFLVLSAVIGFAALKVLFPQLFLSLESSFEGINLGMVQNSLARELVGEMSPARYGGLVSSFSSMFFASLIGLGIILWQFVKTKKPELFLLFFWTVFILFMCGLVPIFGQNRFNIYLVPVFALLSAFVLVKWFSLGWLGLRYAINMAQGQKMKKYLLLGSVTMIFASLFLLLYPAPFNLAEPFPNMLPDVITKAMATAGSPSLSESDTYELMDWLKNNTPDPGLDYYAFYGEQKDFKYPAASYGILAKWDFGHMITYYARRIPNSNPFQQGIGKKNSDGSITPGEATFFLAGDEAGALKQLDEMKTKYVVADYVQADAGGGFLQMIKWQDSTLKNYLQKNTNNLQMERFYNSMIARLELFDGSEKQIDDKNNNINIIVPAVGRLRLVYETKTTAFSAADDAKKEIKMFKVFEYVKGAKITGSAGSGQKVLVTADIATNQNREFVYQQTIEAKNGKFEFVVPYAARYKVKIGGAEITAQTAENDVLQGKTIKIN